MRSAGPYSSIVRPYGPRRSAGSASTGWSTATWLCTRRCSAGRRPASRSVSALPGWTGTRVMPDWRTCRAGSWIESQAMGRREGPIGRLSMDARFSSWLPAIRSRGSMDAGPERCSPRRVSATRPANMTVPPPPGSRRRGHRSRGLTGRSTSRPRPVPLGTDDHVEQCGSGKAIRTNRTLATVDTPRSSCGLCADSHPTETPQGGSKHDHQCGHSPPSGCRPGNCWPRRWVRGSSGSAWPESGESCQDRHHHSCRSTSRPWSSSSSRTTRRPSAPV